MKTITLNKISKSVVLIALFALFTTNSNAQNAASWGNVYVGDNGQMHVFTTDFNFMTQIAPAAGTKTSRTNATYGKISFADAVAVNTTNSASETSQRYIDGYFRKYGTTAIVMPVGQTNIYAPAKVVPTDATGVDGAYYRANPIAVGATVDAALNLISSVEYWHILRPATGTSNATISLSWSATSTSGVATLTTSSLNSLTIAGWNGTRWVAIPSAFDATKVTDTATPATTLASGSITSSAVVDLSVYQYFTLAGKATCSPLIAVVPAKATTWNGSAWSNGIPGLDAAVTLTGNYSGNLSCNSLAMGAFNVTLTNGQLLEIVNGITRTTGKVIMASEASLVQRDAAAVAPAIELTKLSRTMLWRDYIYYGTPISGNFLGQLLTNTWNQGQSYVAGGSFEYGNVGGVGGPWEYIVNGGGWNAILTTKTGKGFIAAIKGNAPWVAGTVSTPGTGSGQVNFKFDGTANNGDVVVPVTQHAKAELLANPYPSAIDAQKFLVGNPNLQGELYFWTAKTLRVAPATNAVTYTSADYAVWTTAGGVNTSPIAQTPDGKIASAQGFRVRATTTGNATFTNCMRLTSGNNNFFRQAATVVDRFKMNVQDNNNSASYSQILVAYMPEATNDFDNMYDANRFSISPVQLYPLLPDNTKLAINAKASFVDTDVVPLGFSNTTADQTFTITIQDKEGVFSDNSVYVYIHDKLNDVYHNMATPFTFNANNQAEINSRFEITYKRNALNGDDILGNEVFINIKNNTFTAFTVEVAMLEIEIFDITGRKIQSYDGNNTKSVSQPFNHAEGIYVAKVKLANGSISTQKLINKK